ncbi:hypothetical protein NDU88_008928 [Pleurodeles waltl]|uniref:Uncharacterized protein n=1 Tax=Pleurodeles waltl TaxID=8319 RepID=A0AAV7RV76_PLEWA|nr:hypothetical protein NDU88_008928 [Pleurodeles waltl]
MGPPVPREPEEDPSGRLEESPARPPPFTKPEAYLFWAAERERRGPANKIEVRKRAVARGRGALEVYAAAQEQRLPRKDKLTFPGPRGSKTRPGLQSARIRTRQQADRAKQEPHPQKGGAAGGPALHRQPTRGRDQD